MELDEHEGKMMAFDIACPAHAALPKGVRFEHYQVVFNPRTQVGITLSHTYANAFAESDLCPEPCFQRSATVENDRLAEPLDAEAESFQTALTTTHRCVEHLQAGEYSAIYAMCGEELRSTWDEAKFTGAFRQDIEKFGAIRAYEPMQWKFVVRGPSTRRLLICTKIVEHERRVLNYSFTFDLGWAHKTLIGFQWATRPKPPSAKAHK